MQYSHALRKRRKHGTAFSILLLSCCAYIALDICITQRTCSMDIGQCSLYIKTSQKLKHCQITGSIGNIQELLNIVIGEFTSVNVHKVEYDTHIVQVIPDVFKCFEV